jgi:hypothetical protein
MEIILDVIENLFLLWFILSCFKINILTDKVKSGFLLGVFVIGAILIQNITFVSDEILNLFLLMPAGIIFYSFSVKVFYNVKFFKSMMYFLFYFMFCIIGLESIFAFAYGYTGQENFIALLFLSIPIRIIQSLVILGIYKFKQRGKSNMLKKIIEWFKIIKKKLLSKWIFFYDMKSPK